MPSRKTVYNRLKQLGLHRNKYNENLANLVFTPDLAALEIEKLRAISYQRSATSKVLDKYDITTDEHLDFVLSVYNRLWYYLRSQGIDPNPDFLEKMGLE